MNHTAETVSTLERRLMAKVGWPLFMISLLIIGWMGRELWAAKVSQDAHAPTLLASEQYADTGDEKVSKKVEGISAEVQEMSETVSWMAGVMEATSGFRRPEKLLRRHG